MTYKTKPIEYIHLSIRLNATLSVRVEQHHFRPAMPFHIWHN
ncbi:hypothetical protein [Xenorhabdus szentirmaii]|nr:MULTISPECIES: hypothetical protein [unclassified Xenorhabdus]